MTEQGGKNDQSLDNERQTKGQSLGLKANQWSNIAGEARTYWWHQIGTCHNMLVIHVSSPASPLQNHVFS
jgi:hypothetical protein